MSTGHPPKRLVERRSLRAAATVLVAAGLGLSSLIACSSEEPTKLTDPGSGGEEKKAGPTETPEPEPTETATGGEGKSGGGSEGKTGGKSSQGGEDLTEVDAATAGEVETFILDAMSTLDAAWASGETDEWKAAYTGTCAKCGERSTLIDAIYGDGGRVEGGEYVDPQPEIVGQQEDGTIVVRVTTDVAAYEVFGSQAQQGPADHRVETYSVAQSDNGWKIAHWR